MPRISHTSAILALAASLSMAATSAAAVELPVQTMHSAVPATHQAATGDESAARHRWNRYRRNRMDAGDVLAGVLIIGGIAAVASAATRADRNRRDDDYRYRDYRYRDQRYRNDDYRYRQQRGDSRYDAGSGIDNAVDMCVREIERNVRVNTVDTVDRTGEGWFVRGSLYDGAGFTCRIGSDGRVSDIDYSGQGSVTYDGPSQDNQWDDARYRAARASTGYATPDMGQPAYSGGSEPSGYGTTDENLPAYPGGPVEGYEYPDD